MVNISYEIGVEFLKFFDYAKQLLFYIDNRPWKPLSNIYQHYNLQNFKTFNNLTRMRLLNAFSILNFIEAPNLKALIISIQIVVGVFLKSELENVFEFFEKDFSLVELTIIQTSDAKPYQRIERSVLISDEILLEILKKQKNSLKILRIFRFAKSEKSLKFALREMNLNHLEVDVCTIPKDPIWERIPMKKIANFNWGKSTESNSAEKYLNEGFFDILEDNMKNDSERRWTSNRHKPDHDAGPSGEYKNERKNEGDESRSKIVIHIADDDPKKSNHQNISHEKSTGAKPKHPVSGSPYKSSRKLEENPQNSSGSQSNESSSTWEFLPPSSQDQDHPQPTFDSPSHKVKSFFNNFSHFSKDSVSEKLKIGMRNLKTLTTNDEHLNTSIKKLAIEIHNETQYKTWLVHICKNVEELTINNFLGMVFAMEIQNLKTLKINQFPPLTCCFDNLVVNIEHLEINELESPSFFDFLLCMKKLKTAKVSIYDVKFDEREFLAKIPRMESLEEIHLGIEREFSDGIKNLKKHPKVITFKGDVEKNKNLPCFLRYEDKNFFKPFDTWFRPGFPKFTTKLDEYGSF